MRPHLLSALVLLAVLATGCATSPSPTSSASPTATPAARAEAPSATTARLRSEAAKLLPLATTAAGRDFLRATAALSAQPTRSALQDPITRDYFSVAGAAALAETRRAKLVPIELDEERYYYTKYGSSLAYLRAIDLATTHGVSTLAGKSILDFGYGAITHLRLLASLGAHSVGVDPDSYLSALYAHPSDQGAVANAQPLFRGAPGSVTLVHAKWPKDAQAREQVSARAPFDLVLSKNTLKRGYIKPERAVANKRQLVDLGVSDDIFLAALYEALKPGGLLLIYNIAPKPSPPGQPFQPWSDGRSPYSREQFVKAGFRIVVLDANDDPFVRKMGALLDWDKDKTGQRIDDLETNLFALYTIVQRP